MSQVDDKFIKELQKQCIVDGLEHLNTFRGSLMILQQSPGNTFISLMKSCHTLKGDLQAAGFLNCAEFIHALETVLFDIEKKANGNWQAVPATEWQVLEFMLSDVAVNIETYLQELQTKQDSPQLLADRKLAVTILSSWNPFPGGEAPPPPETVVVELPTELAAPPVLTVVPSESPEPVPAVVEASSTATAPPTATPPSAPPPVRKVESQSEETKKSDIFLLCKNADLLFAIPISKVIEIVQQQDWNKLPAPRQDLLGLMNLRGEVMPIVNLKDTLGLSKNEGRGYVVVCNNKNDTHFGFAVEEAEQILEFNLDSFQPASQLSGCIPSDLVKYFSLIEEKTVLILDLEKAFAA